MNSIDKALVAFITFGYITLYCILQFGQTQNGNSFPQNQTQHGTESNRLSEFDSEALAGIAAQG